MTKNSSINSPMRITKKIDDIRRWQEAGFYDLADVALKRSLNAPKTCGDIAKWMFEQKNGKAAQGVELSGSLGLSLTDLAKEALEKPRS